MLVPGYKTQRGDSSFWDTISETKRIPETPSYMVGNKNIAPWTKIRKRQKSHWTAEPSAAAIRTRRSHEFPRKPSMD